MCHSVPAVAPQLGYLPNYPNPHCQRFRRPQTVRSGGRQNQRQTASTRALSPTSPRGLIDRLNDKAHTDAAGAEHDGCRHCRNVELILVVMFHGRHNTAPHKATTQSPQPTVTRSRHAARLPPAYLIGTVRWRTQHTVHIHSLQSSSGSEYCCCSTWAEGRSK